MSKNDMTRAGVSGSILATFDPVNYCLMLPDEELKNYRPSDPLDKNFTKYVRKEGINGQTMSYYKYNSGGYAGQCLKLTKEITSLNDDNIVLLGLELDISNYQVSQNLSGIRSLNVANWYEVVPLPQKHEAMGNGKSIVVEGSQDFTCYRPGSGVIANLQDGNNDTSTSRENRIITHLAFKLKKEVVDAAMTSVKKAVTIQTRPLGVYMTCNSSSLSVDPYPLHLMPVMIEWVFKKQIELGFTTNVKEIHSPVNKIIRFNYNINSLPGVLVPTDYSIGDYIKVELTKDNQDAIVNVKVEGNSISVSSVSEVSGNITLKFSDDFMYTADPISIPYRFVKSGLGGNDKKSNSVKIQSEEGAWLTLNFDTKPSQLLTELRTLGDETLTATRFNTILKTIEEGKKNNNASTYLLPAPKFKINNQDVSSFTTTDRLLMYNSFNLELLEPAMPMLKNKVYGLEVMVVNDDDTLPVDFYPDVKAAEIRGFLIHNPSVGVHSCKLFGLNYDSKQGRGVSSNTIRYDDGINALIDKEDVKDKGIVPLKLKVRFAGEICSDWVVCYINFIKNVNAPFWYKLTEPVEATSDFLLSGSITLAGKTIELLKTSKTIILEEANNTTDTPITTGKSMELKKVVYEVHDNNQYTSKPVFSIDKVITRDQLTDEEIVFDFSKTEAFSNKTLKANVQYYFTAKLVFEHTDPTTSKVITYEITPYHDGIDLSNVECYGIIPFNINNFRSIDDIEINAKPIYGKEDKLYFDLSGTIDVVAFNKNTQPTIIEKSLYSIEGYKWNLIGLGSNSDFSISMETVDPVLNINKDIYLKDGDYELRVNAKTDRFDLLYLNKTTFKINTLETEIPDDEVDPETIYQGEYDRLVSIKAQSDGWKYYGELSPDKFQDPRIKYTGRWNSGKSYTVGDEVNKNGSLYICINNTPTGNYDFKQHFRGINTKPALALYKSGLVSPQEVLNRLGMDSNYTNNLQPNKNNPSYNHEQKPVSWLKVKNPQGEMLYISKKPVLKNVSLNDLVKADMLHPYQRTIRIGPHLYYPRWLIDTATYPVEPLLEDIKDRADYFTKNNVKVTEITRKEQTALLKLVNNNGLGSFENNDLGINSSAYSEFVYNKDYPKQLKYDSYGNQFVEMKLASGDKVMEGLRLVLERIPEDERPHKHINPNIPGNNTIVEGSFDPVADVGFLDYVEIDRFMDMSSVLKQLKVMEGQQVQSFGYYKFYYQGQVIFIADGLNLKDIAIDRLMRYNLVHYSPQVKNARTPQAITDIGRVCYDGLPYSVSMLKVVDGPMMLSQKKVGEGLFDIFTNTDSKLDFELSRHAQFTLTVMGASVTQLPTKLTEGYKGSIPHVDISRTIDHMGTGSLTEGVMTRTLVKDTNEVVTQLDNDMFRIGKMARSEKGRVSFVLSTPATTVMKLNGKK